MSLQQTLSNRIGRPNPAVDLVSGAPEFKHTPVRVEPFIVERYAFLLSREALALDSIVNWTRILCCNVQCEY